MEASDLRTARRRRNEQRTAGRADGVPPVLDELAFLQWGRASEALEEIALDRARDDRDHMRERRERELRAMDLAIEDHESALEHRKQMRRQAEWRGVLQLLGGTLVIAWLVVVLGEVATRGALWPELLRLARALIP